MVTWRATRLIGLLSVLVVGACTCACNAPEELQPRGLAVGSPSDGTIALVVTPELRAARWQESINDDTSVAELGEPLIENSRRMLEGMFRTVRVVPSASPIPGVRFYVMPTMHYIAHADAAWAFGDQIFIMKLEWRVINDSGETVFIDTIVGEARGRTGNIFTYQGDTREVLLRLVDDTFAKSRESLAPVLKGG